MIAPTHYRTLLTPDEQEIYKTIVNGLIRYENSIRISQSTSIQRVVNAIHLDHPELFFVDFWHYQVSQSFLPPGAAVNFQMLLARDTAHSVANTLSLRATALQSGLPLGVPPEQQYYHVARHIASSTAYIDSGSGFWDHTCAGPGLKGTAVCEGIAKLFLFFCQRLQLPCAIVTGSLNGTPHAWNMVDLHGRIRYIDVTGMLHIASRCPILPLALFRTESQLHLLGYEW